MVGAWRRAGRGVGRMIYHPGGRRERENRQTMDVYCGGVTIEVLSAKFGF